VLTREIMGWVALWILWGNTLLIALAALKNASKLARRASELKAREGAARGADALFRARIVGARGERFAAFVVDQLGRFGAGSTRSILWNDRSYRSTLDGGTLEIGGERVEVEPRDDADVWMGADEVEMAAACADRGSFEDAYPSAKKMRGVERSLAVELRKNREVFVLGRIAERNGTLVLEPPASGAILVAAMDPVRWLSRRVTFARWVFVPAIALGAAACTALALTPPVFESVASKAGGILGLTFFLIVLPAGTSLRDFLREPSRRIVRGSWEEPAQSLFRRPSAARASASAASSIDDDPLAGDPLPEDAVPAPRTVQAPPSG
jgi:hypothetical protein